jgi:hypothetical protein
MTQLHKKLFLFLFAVITIAALLLPVPKVATHTAGLDETAPAVVQEIAGLEYPGWWWDKGDVTINGYTWAG